MARWIREPEYHEQENYHLFWESKDTPGWGVGVDCDKDGKYDLSTLTEEARKNITEASTSDKFKPAVMKRWTQRWRDPGVIECNVCGGEVVLDDAMTNRCPNCRTFYNGSGQQLAPPSQWGEETGERFDDEGNQIL